MPNIYFCVKSISHDEMCVLGKIYDSIMFSWLIIPILGDDKRWVNNNPISFYIVDINLNDEHNE